MTPLSQPHYDFLMEKITDKALSPGCRARQSLTIYTLVYQEDDSTAGKWMHGDYIESFDKSEFDEIIGHEPTLASILVALRKNGYSASASMRDADGLCEIIVHSKKTNKGMMCIYNASKDRLCDQSGPTVIWLAELFGFTNPTSK